MKTSEFIRWLKSRMRILMEMDDGTFFVDT